jgi:hypothetical protein
MMSREVRERGSWVCVRCRQSFATRRHLLGTSHFFNKGTCAALRYDTRNLDPLCHECHTGRDGWEYQKAGDYLMYMMRKLGHEEYGQLVSDSLRRVKLDDAKATFLEKLKGGTLWRDGQPSWA